MTLSSIVFWRTCWRRGQNEIIENTFWCSHTKAEVLVRLFVSDTVQKKHKLWWFNILLFFFSGVCRIFDAKRKVPCSSHPQNKNRSCLPCSKRSQRVEKKGRETALYRNWNTCTQPYVFYKKIIQRCVSYAIFIQGLQLQDRKTNLVTMTIGSIRETFFNKNGSLLSFK